MRTEAMDGRIFDQNLIKPEKANPFAVYEAANILVWEILPQMGDVKRKYSQILENLHPSISAEARKVLNLNNKDLYLNLSAASWALHCDVIDMHQRQVLVPSVLTYQAVARCWDDEIDSLDGRGNEPLEVFNNGIGRRMYEEGLKMLKSSRLIKDEDAFKLRQKATQYVLAEGILLDYDWTVGRESGEVLEDVIRLRELSFGQMAEELTGIMAINGGLKWKEVNEAKKKMSAFAVWGGLLDAYIDRGEDGGTAMCASNFKTPDLMRQANIQLAKIV